MTNEKIFMSSEIFLDFKEFLDKCNKDYVAIKYYLASNYTYLNWEGRVLCFVRSFTNKTTFSREFKIYFKTEVKESNHNKLFGKIVLKKTNKNKY
jgi:hypothetical protein